MKKLQIGIIGSMADVELSNANKNIAQSLGEEIAKSGAVLLFGYEGDYSSLSYIAAQSAQINGGESIAFIWGEKKQNIQNLDSVQIVTGQMRGGGREYSFILSCDAIIAIGGGSGTLMEISMAYQNNIPIITVKGTGGWSEKLANQYIDERKRIRVVEAGNAIEAVKIAIETSSNTESS